MKTKYTIALYLLLAAACSSIQEEPVNTERAKGAADEVFYATLEQSGSTDATKVYADENLKVLWNADDRITIFNRYTYGYQYAFQGESGETTGTFAKVEDDAEFVVGNDLDDIYAVYPYSPNNRISDSGEISIIWPSSQTYEPDSFGYGANVMVSTTTDNRLRFKNVGGYLALKLYGNNVSVTSITLRGNTRKRLSGKATVNASANEDPTLIFQTLAIDSLSLKCPTPVKIGNSTESATIFWMVVPPTEFEDGFNITVRTSDGRFFVKYTNEELNIQRNTLCRMAAVEVVPSNNVPFVDANFKDYCVTNFDTDNDGEISISEALAVEYINVCTDNIYSLGGIEFFINLRYLFACGSRAYHRTLDGGGYGYGNDPFSLPEPKPGTTTATGKLASVNCSGLMNLEYVDLSNNNITIFTPGNSPSLRSVVCSMCNITELDLSQNTALNSLTCYNNQLTVLDVSNNTELTYLYCYSNQLTALDVSNNTELTYLHCSDNPLTALDVSNNTALTYLYCYSNQLTALDVSNNTALRELACQSNQLTALDVSNNTALRELACQSNQLIALDVNNNTALTYLYCYSNQLTALDVSNNTVLTSLYCSSNQLTTLDVSNNTALTYLYCESNQLTTLNVSNNTALTSLDCGSNQLTTLDVSNNTALTYLNCSLNQLTALDVSNNTVLTSLYCSSNQLTTLDVSNNTALTSLWCNNNQLTALDVNNNLALTSLVCDYNQLTALDVSNNTALTWLWCGDNPYLTDIWLKTGQTIQEFSYDTNVAQIQYKD